MASRTLLPFQEFCYAIHALLKPGPPAHVPHSSPEAETLNRHSSASMLSVSIMHQLRTLGIVSLYVENRWTFTFLSALLADGLSAAFNSQDFLLHHGRGGILNYFLPKRVMPQNAASLELPSRIDRGQETLSPVALAIFIHLMSTRSRLDAASMELNSCSTHGVHQRSQLV